MRKKTVILTVILLAVTTTLFAEDLEFVAIRRTMLYRDGPTFSPSRDALFEIEAGTKVRYFQGRSSFIAREDIDRFTENELSVIIGTFEYNNRRVLINTADLIPANTIDTFNPAFICDLNSDNRKTWVPWYFPKALRAMDRDIILLYDTFWREGFDPHPPGDRYRSEWYEAFFARFPRNEFNISNSAFVFDTLQGFIIRNIQRLSNGYIVTVEFGNTLWLDFELGGLNWDKVRGKDFFDMIFHIDGDFMDVFLVDTDHKLTTFVRVDQVFLQEFQSLGLTQQADLSRLVSWPRRADGTMDFPPSEVFFGTTHYTTANLRLRSLPDIAGEIITTIPNGAAVMQMEIGHIATIDGITAPWMRVRTANGIEGWCFSGFLEAVYVPAPVVEAQHIENIVAVNPIGQPAHVMLEQGQDSNNTVLFVILGAVGVVLAIGILVILLRKRKK